MTLRTLGLAAISAGVLATAGCATYDQPYYGSAAPVYGSPPYTVYERPATVVPASEYGVVESIDLYRAGGGAPTGLGAVIGGIAGGIIGHQFGAGHGNTAATIGGAVAGGVIGNEVEKASPRDRYRIRVRLDSGGVLDLADAGEGQLRVGDRVRVVDGRVYRM
jgi:outer membrane lipoprotein SlyB